MKQINSQFNFSKPSDVKTYLDLYTHSSDENRLNKLKFQAMCFFLKPYIKSKRVIDLGCGEAFYCNWIVDQGVLQYTGIDISAVLIKQAQEKYRFCSCLKFLTGDFFELGKVIGKSKFDVALSIFSLMRVKNLLPLFSMISNILNPNGLFLIMSNTYRVDEVDQEPKIVKIKKNNKLYLKNFPRTIEEYIKTATKAKFELIGFFSQPFSKNKIIENQNDFRYIEGYDSTILFKKTI